ncbi:hypothetical protein [Cohnella thailandensis]|uniref:Spore coat protein D n=1 Tax=Cohnella thailandensis TaxID=557557 RepID=A0A841SUF6_9BACL|nr:hypothetical protein [Cohnella thailandensis]MBB6634639.1 hypothetical protein [Cohnella thailandensis]MBP1972805.1 hypothetical protein [Cohnella thailandensis]
MSDCPKCPTKTVYDPPQVVYEDIYHPQVVQVVHHVEVIRRHHCVPVPQHIYTCSSKDVFCDDMAETRGIHRSGSRSRLGLRGRR